MKQTTTNLTKLTAIAVLAVGAASSQGQLLYSEDFDTDVNIAGNWVTNVANDGPADLYFDYSTIGIPPAPNSSGTTRGVKLQGNISVGVFPGGVSVSPLNFDLSPSSSFVIHCDVWWNFNGPAPGGGSGSTQVGGVGFGTAGTVPQVPGTADSVYFMITSEGGSSIDYRAYSPAIATGITPDTGSFVAGTHSTARNAGDPYYTSNFPGGISAPAAQLALYPQQTGATAAGTPAWAWHDFSIEKIGPYATWSLDGIPIAVVDVTTNGSGGTDVYGGTKLLLNHCDINAGFSTDSNFPALNFTLFDNLRVSNVVANVVTVTAPPSTQTDEAFGTPATFTFNRSITGSPLTVNYSIGGTAQNGADYTNQLGGALTGSITFGASDSSVNLNVVAVNDTESEPVETISIAVASGVGYVAAGSAEATIKDNDTPLLIVSVDSPSMYERHTNDYASVKVTRWGDTDAFLQIEATNFTFSGGAVQNVDYVVDTSLFPFFINPSEVEVTNRLVNPLDNSSYTGNKTIVVGMVAGPGFSASNATASLTIRDDENPTATVLYSNPLTSAADASNWSLTYANGDMLTLGNTDYEASFGFDLNSEVTGGPVAPPPGGAGTALRATVNKNVANNAGLNIYMTNQSFSGDYAVRFNMNIVMDTSAAVSTHGPLFGINHDGNQTNWWAGSGVISGGPWASDGVWYWISPDGGAGAGDYLLFTGLGGALPNTGWQRPATANLDAFTKLFKGVGGLVPDPGPYSGYAGPGLIGNDPVNVGGNTTTWTDVEIKQAGNVVTLYLNKVQVLSYVNTTTFKSGYLMLGYNDPFNSLGNPSGAAYFANLSVVRIDPPEITNITRGVSDVTIDFTSNDGTAPLSAYALEGAAAVEGPYTAVAGSSIVQVSPGVYQATASATADQQYYRIRK